MSNNLIWVYVWINDLCDFRAEYWKFWTWRVKIGLREPLFYTIEIRWLLLVSKAFNVILIHIVLITLVGHSEIVLQISYNQWTSYATCLCDSAGLHKSIIHITVVWLSSLGLERLLFSLKPWSEVIKSVRK